MGKRLATTLAAAVVVVMWAADVGLCKDDGAMENARNVEVKTEEMKQNAAEAMHDKGKADSLTDWAYGKFSEEAIEVAQNIKDKASKTSDSMKHSASEAYRYASEKNDEVANKAYDKVGDMKDFTSENAGQVIRMASDGASDDARETVAGTMNYGKHKAANSYDMASNWVSDSKDAMAEGMHYGRSRLSNAHDEAKQKLGFYKNMDSEKLGDAKEWMTEAMEHGKERAANVHDEAKQKFNQANAVGHERWNEMDVFEEAINTVGEAYRTAKDTLNFQGNLNYEAAKERMSKATGDLGAKMRNEVAADMYDEAKQKIGLASDIASEKASNGKEAKQGATCEEMVALDEAANSVGEAYRLDKERTFQVKSRYEAAKERMSKASGDVGAKLGECTADS